VFRTLHRYTSLTQFHAHALFTMASELPQVQCINDDIDNKDSYNDTTTKDDYGIGVVQNVSVQLADPKLARRVVRKIDLCVLLCMFVTYNLTFIDKYILASASVLGLTKDTHLHGSEYGWVGSIFYFGWLVWEYPAAVLVQKLPVGKYIAGVTFIWGAVVAVTASTSNFGGLAVCRILLGMAEATISPAFIFITSTWYTRSEIPFRLGIWSSGNSIGSIIASICAYGIGQIEHPLHPWQWLFIIFGIATSLWSIVLFFFLPDSIDTAIFLDEEEKRYAQDRVVLAGTGRVSGENKKYKFEQVIECFKDPKTYFSAAITILTMIPNGGTGTFGNLALKSFGFTNLQTMLVNLPVGVIAFITINITGWIASRYQNMALILLMITVIPPVVGCALIAQLENKGVRLFGYYCVSRSFPANRDLAVSYSLLWSPCT